MKLHLVLVDNFTLKSNGNFCADYSTLQAINQLSRLYMDEEDCQYRET